MSKSESKKEPTIELEPRSFVDFFGSDIKLARLEAKQKADSHGNPVKNLNFIFTGSFDLKNLKEEVIDTVKIRLTVKTGPEGMNRLKQITQIYAIHQYAKFVLLPSEYKDMDLSKELLKQNTLDQFFSLQRIVTQ